MGGVAWLVAETARLLASADYCVANRIPDFESEVTRLVHAGGYANQRWSQMQSKLIALSKHRPNGKSKPSLQHIKTYGSKKLKLTPELRAAIDLRREQIIQERDVANIDEQEVAVASVVSHNPPDPYTCLVIRKANTDRKADKLDLIQT